MFTINRPQMPDFTNPIGLLVHCHERIENQLTILERAGDLILKHDSSLPTVFTAVDGACAHFRIAGVKHTEDEELSLFPRLLDRGGALAEEAISAVAELQAQHRGAESLHAELDRLVDILPRDRPIDTNYADRFNQLVAELLTIYRPHILRENEFVFPIARDILQPVEIQALGEEMRERRKDLLQKISANR